MKTKASCGNRESIQIGCVHHAIAKGKRGGAIARCVDTISRLVRRLPPLKENDVGNAAGQKAMQNMSV